VKANERIEQSKNLKYYRVGQKRTVLRVDNFAMVNGKKLCNVKVSEFCLEKVLFCMSVHINSQFDQLHST